VETPLLIADASTLLNFLFVERFDLVQGLGYRVRIVDAVYEEVETARKALDRLIEQGHVNTLSFEGVEYFNRLASLINRGLGTGEAFTVAAAIERGGIVAMDDRRAIKKSREAFPNLVVLTTVDIVVAGIRTQKLSVVDADRIKAEWSSKYRFHLKLQSFGDLMK